MTNVTDFKSSRYLGYGNNCSIKRFYFLQIHKCFMHILNILKNYHCGKKKGKERRKKERKTETKNQRNKATKKRRKKGRQTERQKERIKERRKQKRNT